MKGNQACVEGAISAGCRFLGMYPIEPAIEIGNYFLERAKTSDAVYVQMEDEISALAAVLGASWTGRRSMTVTSGPGFSLMMEHLGLGVMLETPCVIVDVQRVGPGHGLPTKPAQGDLFQARWGSHGDYEIITLAPSTVQEIFDFMIKAFNFSEHYRVPVVVLLDSYLVNLESEVTIPRAEDIELEPRRYYKGPQEEYLPFKRDKDLVPWIVDIGAGYKFHVTGLTHDERGYPIMNEECQEFNVHSLVRKIRNYTQKIVQFKTLATEDAEVVIVAYGTSFLAAQEAQKRARDAGIKAGLFKLDTVWPFPETQIRELSKKTKAFVVVEMNYGQFVYEMERCCQGNANIAFVAHGEKGVENSDDILNAVIQISRENSVKEGIIEYATKL